MLNITRDTGAFLAVLVRATLARQVLEIGTSNGYSTLWLASAARAIGGSVVMIELSEYKIRLAAANFARSGLSPYISLVQDDAGWVLERSGEGVFDLIFLDSERAEYPGWWPYLKRVLGPGGLLVVDNATSHATEMAPFVALVTADSDFATSLVSVGKVLVPFRPHLDKRHVQSRIARRNTKGSQAIERGRNRRETRSPALVFRPGLAQRVPPARRFRARE